MTDGTAVQAKFASAFSGLPPIAILRGVTPREAPQVVGGLDRNRLELDRSAAQFATTAGLFKPGIDVETLRGNAARFAAAWHSWCAQAGRLETRAWQLQEGQLLGG